MGVRMRQKDGKWYVFINHKGRRKAKCIGESKRAAAAVKQQLEARLALGDFALTEDPGRVPLFADYATQWLETHGRLNCKPASYERYSGILRLHLLPALGALRLDAITRETVRTLTYQLRARLSVQGVALACSPLRMILNQAYDDGMLQTNPATHIRKLLPKRRQSAAPQRYLTREDLRAALRAVQQFSPAYFPLFLCLARTGMRLGEALGLQWEDIHWRQGWIEIQRSYRHGHEGTPKSGTSRTVDMSQQLHHVLHTLCLERKAATLQHGWGQLPPWVFCSDTGTRLDGALVRYYWHRCLDKARLPKVRIHDLRHTYASLLLQQGESLVYVKDQLGHTSIQMTVDTYGHLVPGGNRHAVDQLDDAPPRNRGATVENHHRQAPIQPLEKPRVSSPF